MKGLQEYLMEASSIQAGGEEIRYKFAPVVAAVWGKAEESKFETTLTQIFKEVPGSNENTDIDSFYGWILDNRDGKTSMRKTWQPYNFDPNEFSKHIHEYMEAKFGVNEKTKDDTYVEIDPKYFNSLGVKLPKDMHVGLFYHRGVPNIYVYFLIEDIENVWHKFNPAQTLDFERFGTPGRNNDVAGRPLQVNDIVAFSSNANDGRLEIGVITSLKSRPVIWTENEIKYTVDGSRVCLLKRGNLIVQ